MPNNDQKMNAPNFPKPWMHDLWAHLHNEHGLTLLESEIYEIVRLAAPPRSFRAGDKVHHEPSGEDWTLANDEENGKVSPSGWPESMADAKDCRLLEPASEIDRIHALQAWAKEGLGYEHERDHRTLAARRQLSPTTK